MSKKNKLKAELILEVAQLQERVKDLEAGIGESRWHDIVESSPDHILTLDPDLKIQYVNRPSPGLTIEELVGSPIIKFVVKEKQKEIKAILMGVLNTRLPALYETEFPTPDGGMIYYETHAIPRTSAGKVVGLFLSSRDITQRFQAEVALKQQKQRIQSIFRSAPVGIGVVKNRILIEVNDRLCTMTGYSEAELINQNARMVYPTQEDYEYVGQEKYNQIGKTGTGAVQTRFQRKDGEVIDILLSSTPIDRGDLSKGVTFSALDISEMVKAQTDLQTSEQLLNTTQQLIKAGGWKWNVENKTMFWTDETYRLHEMDRTEIEPGSIKHIERGLECYDEKDRQIILKAFQNCLDEGVPFDLEFPFTTVKGNRIWIRTTAQAKKENDQVVNVVGNIVDITESKQAEIELKEVAQQWQTTFDAVTDAVFLMDAESRITRTNQAMNKIFPEYKGKMIGRYCWQIVHGTEEPIAEYPVLKMRKSLQRENESISIGDRVYEVIVDPILDESRKLIGAVHLMRDITERVLIRENLKKQKNFSEKIINTSNAIIVGLDKNQLIKLFNNGAEMITGYKRTNVLGKNWFKIFFPAEISDEMDQVWESAWGERVHSNINPIRIKNGAERIISWQTTGLYDEDDEKNQLLISIGEDITERVLAEEEIKQRTDDLTLVNSINSAINRGLDLPEILKLLAEEVKRILNSNNTTVYLYNQDHKYLEMQYLALPTKLVKRIEKLIGINFPVVRIPVEEGSLAQEKLLSDGPQLVNDPELIQKWMLEFTHSSGISEKSRDIIQKLISQVYKLVDIQSIISIPMIAGGELIGLVDISRHELFTEEDAERISDNVGQVTAAIISLRTKKENARSQNLLLTLSQAAPAINQANNADEIYRAIGEQAVKMDFDVTVFTLSDDGKNLVVSYHSLIDLARKVEKLTGLSAAGYSFPLVPEGFFHKIISGHETVYSHLEIEPIAEALPRIVRPIAQKIMDLLGGQQSIIAPLVVHGQVYGLLSFSGKDLSRSDVPAITTFANQAAIALEKTSLFTETKELAAFNEGIVQNMAEGIALEDAEGIFTFVNPAAERLLGFPMGELVGKHWKIIVPPDQQPIIQVQNKKRSQGESAQYEIDLINKEGQRVSVLASGSPRTDEKSRFTGSLVVFTDITDRVQAEDEIKQSLRRMEALRIIDQAIMGSFDINISLNIILEQVLVQLEVDAAAVLLHQVDLQSLNFTHGRGFHTDALQYTDLRLGEGYAGRVGLKRTPVFIPDLTQEKGEIPESSQFKKEGFVSYYGVPLIAKGILV
ncbi:MAG: PAS domain S-box protein, partial [Chloroflexi bacterium]|nr:PAS domain S-box protein [Chloroflexota bacterium]